MAKTTIATAKQNILTNLTIENVPSWVKECDARLQSVLRLLCACRDAQPLIDLRQSFRRLGAEDIMVRRPDDPMPLEIRAILPQPSQHRPAQDDGINRSRQQINRALRARR